MSQTNIQKHILAVKHELNRSIGLLQDFTRDSKDENICYTGIVDKSFIDNVLSKMATCVNKINGNVNSGLKYDKDDIDFEPTRKVLEAIPIGTYYKLLKPSKKIINNNKRAHETWILDPKPKLQYINVKPTLKKDGIRHKTDYDFGLQTSDKPFKNIYDTHLCSNGIVEEGFIDTLKSKMKSCIKQLDKDAKSDLDFDMDASEFAPTRKILENIPKGKNYKLYRPSKIMSVDNNLLSRNNSAPNKKSWVLDPLPEEPFIKIKPSIKNGDKNPVDYEFGLKIDDETNSETQKTKECSNGIVEEGFIDTLKSKMKSCIKQFDKHAKSDLDFDMDTDNFKPTRKILENIPKGKNYKLYRPSKIMSVDNNLLSRNNSAPNKKSWVLDPLPEEPFIKIKPSIKNTDKNPVDYEFGLKIDDEPNSESQETKECSNGIVEEGLIDTLKSKMKTCIKQLDKDVNSDLDIDTNTPAFETVRKILKNIPKGKFYTLYKPEKRNNSNQSWVLDPKIDKSDTVTEPTSINTESEEPFIHIKVVPKKSNKTYEFGLKILNDKPEGLTDEELRLALEALGLTSEAPAANIAVTAVTSPASSAFNSVVKRIGVPKAKLDTNLLHKLPDLNIREDHDLLDATISLVGKPEYLGYDNLARTLGIPPSDAVVNVFKNLGENKTINNLNAIRAKSLQKPRQQAFAGLVKTPDVKKVTNSMRQNAERIRKSRGLKQANGPWNPRKVRGGTKKLKRSKKTRRSKRHQ